MTAPLPEPSSYVTPQIVTSKVRICKTQDEADEWTRRIVRRDADLDISSDYIAEAEKRGAATRKRMAALTGEDFDVLGERDERLRRQESNRERWGRE